MIVVAEAAIKLFADNLEFFNYCFINGAYMRQYNVVLSLCS